MTIRSGSGRDEVREAVECAFLGEQLVGILEALAALRDLAKRGIDRFRIALDTMSGAAEFALADGIADADVHFRRISGTSVILVNAN